MAKNKTTETTLSVTGYINSIVDDDRKKDFAAFVDVFEKEAGLAPKMWGTSIVGFGSYHYKYDSGHEGDAPLIGLSSRASAITLYLPNSETKDELLPKLGKYKTAKSCVYIKKLADVNLEILRELVKTSMEHKKARQQPS